MYFTKPLSEAKFLSRPNRFVVNILIEGASAGASLPNPGKLGELFFPGVTLLVYSMEGRKSTYPWRVAAVETLHGEIVMLDTQVTNRVAEYLITQKRITGLQGWSLVRREFPLGKSRFDFLLRRGDRHMLLEVKSCTLFHGETAMFPDAVTSRGSRHVSELAEYAQHGYDAAVLFIVHGGYIRRFSPEFHTDPVFAQTLYEARMHLRIFAESIGWDRSLRHIVSQHSLTVDWRGYETHGKDSGIYAVVLENREEQSVAIGAMGTRVFQPGFYLYIGSAKNGLTARVARHQRKRKNKHWHIDYLRDATRVVQTFPIRIRGENECFFAQDVSALADEEIRGFGCSDCSCRSHLFYFKASPIQNPSFQEILLRYRMEHVFASLS
ncbi:DNA/RNA nuclease SfsA [Chitinivibrio alkaliphilus]|uniref:Sugar fermentation stimulation protein homolog n=1 Tax=Chitinivibrio alkaliphilus ACht1 TaxID=1313304 RepID=U7DDQ0_9BACT|nr:DNA/RNA nuclease SfsA [Chitinivibrio alkaliphilus]ERP39021.1 sugar fermentation stimulation protein [Chitinivibrio alkaliphilus ACht1]